MRQTTFVLAVALALLAFPTQAQRFPTATDRQIEVIGGLADGAPLGAAREAGALDSTLLVTDLTAAGISALLNNAPPNDGASRGWTVSLPAGINVPITEPIRIDWDPLPTGINHGGVTLDCNGSTIQMAFGGGDDVAAIIIRTLGPIPGGTNGLSIRTAIKNCKIENLNPVTGDRHRGILIDTIADWVQIDNLECIGFYRTNLSEVDTAAKKLAVGHRCIDAAAEISVLQVGGESLLRADGAGFHLEFSATATPGLEDPSWKYTFGPNVIFCSGGLNAGEGAGIYVDIADASTQTPPGHAAQTEVLFMGSQFYGCAQSHFAGGTLSGTLVLDAINAGFAAAANGRPWWTVGNSFGTTTRIILRGELTRSSPFSGTAARFSSNIMFQLQAGSRIPIIDVHFVDNEVGSGFITDNTVTCGSINSSGGQDTYFKGNSGAFIDAVDDTSELLEWRFRLDALERDGQACFFTNTLFTTLGAESLDAYNSIGSVDYWGEQTEYIGSRRIQMTGFSTFVLKDELITPQSYGQFSAAEFCATRTPAMTAIDAFYVDRSGGGGFTETGLDESAALRRTLATTATDAGLTHNDKVATYCVDPLGGHAGEIAVSESGRASAAGLRTGSWLSFNGADHTNGVQFCQALAVPMFAHDVIAVLDVDTLSGADPSDRIVEALTSGQAYKARCGPFAAMDQVQAQGEVVAFAAGGRHVQGLAPGTLGNILTSLGPNTPPAFVPLDLGLVSAHEHKYFGAILQGGTATTTVSDTLWMQLELDMGTPYFDTTGGTIVLNTGSGGGDLLCNVGTSIAVMSIQTPATLDDGGGGLSSYIIAGGRCTGCLTDTFPQLVDGNQLPIRIGISFSGMDTLPVPLIGLTALAAGDCMGLMILAADGPTDGNTISIISGGISADYEEAQ